MSSINANDVQVRKSASQEYTSVYDGVAKAWFKYNDATPAILDSFGVSSISDNAAGKWSPTLINAMANADYSINGVALALSANGRGGYISGFDRTTNSQTTSAYSAASITLSSAGSDAVTQDMNYANMSILGDLA